MNRFLKWLGQKLFRRKPTPNTTLKQTLGRPRPADSTRPGPNTTQAAADSSGRRRADADSTKAAHIEDGGPGKNVYVRNKYIREDSGTHETLKIVDDSLVEDEDEDGLDPYNTGRFDRSKTWKLRS